MFNPINSLRKDIAKDKASFYGVLVLLLSIILVYALAFLFNSGIEPERVGEANASEELEFNVEPPKEHDWSVFPAISGHSIEQVETLRLAYEISGGDKEFLYMLKGENGAISIDRRSEVMVRKYILDGNGERRKDKNGEDMFIVFREPSYGFCQIHSGYHPEIVGDPRFFTDKKWQLEQCHRLWKGGTKFYGYGNKRKIMHFFAFDSND